MSEAFGCKNVLIAEEKTETEESAACQTSHWS